MNKISKTDVQNFFISQFGRVVGGMRIVGHSASFGPVFIKLLDNCPFTWEISLYDGASKSKNKMLLTDGLTPVAKLESSNAMCGFDFWDKYGDQVVVEFNKWVRLHS